jgi:hypothetical protein
VPLFVEELTKSVLESGVLREEADRYVLDGALPPFAVPTSLHDSLMARLDRLASVRLVAQTGAAIGWTAGIGRKLGGQRGQAELPGGRCLTIVGTEGPRRFRTFALNDTAIT